MNSANDSVSPSPSIGGRRYYGLDALRAAMMMLGIVLHAACSYSAFDLGDTWPYADPTKTLFANLVLGIIHPFRMPTFFLMAGFFGALLLERRGTAAFAKNRAARILVPFLLAYLSIMPLAHFGAQFANLEASGSENSASQALSATLDAPFQNAIGHLWFLYYLLYFYLGTFLLLRLTPAQLKRRVRAIFRSLLSSKLLVLALSVPLSLLCLLMPGGILDTSLVFQVSPTILLAYSLFFGFGWLLYGERAELSLFSQNLRSRALQAAIALTLHLLGGEQTSKLISAGSSDINIFVALTAASGAYVSWSLSFLSIGLFHRYLDRPSAIGRYLSDASYWVYLIHLPIVLCVPPLLLNLPEIAELRMLIVLLATTALSFASYALLVRWSPIGRILNGRVYRSRPGLNSESPSPLRPQTSSRR